MAASVRPSVLASVTRAARSWARLIWMAYGDSMSDAPLFRSLEATVAVNADQHLAGLAASE